jgi:DNA-binding NarL/FixJ family response regulator
MASLTNEFVGIGPTYNSVLTKHNGTILIVNVTVYKILLIEDSKLIRECIAEVISDSPKLTIENIATTSHEAISLLDQHQYDMIVADIELAQGNGFEVIKHIRDKDYALNQPDVIVLTNHGNSFYRNMAKQLGVKHFFDKSLEFETCMDVIQTYAS